MEMKLEHTFILRMVNMKAKTCNMEENALSFVF